MKFLLLSHSSYSFFFKLHRTISFVRDWSEFEWIQPAFKINLYLITNKYSVWNYISKENHNVFFLWGSASVQCLYTSCQHKYSFNAHRPSQTMWKIAKRCLNMIYMYGIEIAKCVCALWFIFRRWNVQQANTFGTSSTM